MGRGNCRYRSSPAYRSFRFDWPVDLVSGRSLSSSRKWGFCDSGHYLTLPGVVSRTATHWPLSKIFQGAIHPERKLLVRSSHRVNIAAGPQKVKNRRANRRLARTRARTPKRGKQSMRACAWRLVGQPGWARQGPANSCLEPTRADRRVKTMQAKRVATRNAPPLRPSPGIGNHA